MSTLAKRREGRGIDDGEGSSSNGKELEKMRGEMGQKDERDE